MQMQEFLNALFARAKSEGIEACEAYIAKQDEFEASVNEGEIIGYTVSAGMGLGFRALIDGKMGYASTQVLDEASIELLVEGVKSNATLIESADEQFIFAGSNSYPKCDSYNPALDELSAADKLSMVKKLELATIAVDERIARTEDCIIMSGSSMVRIVNSLGLDVSHEDNLLCMAVAPIAQQKEQLNSGFEYLVVRDAADMNIDRLAQDAAQIALDGLGAKPVASGDYAIVLHNSAATSLLSVFAGVFSADSAQRGLSQLRGKEGERIAAECVTLMDDPFHPKGQSGAPFDAEGVACYEKKLIDKGTLTTLLHNLKTAKKQGLEKSTANAAKASYASPVGIAPSNFYFEPGSEPLNDLLKRADGGLLITDVQGLHAGANGISGDFSLSAKGFLIEDGAKGRAVNQITISGNFYQLLRDIQALGNDLRFSFPGVSCVGSPSLLIAGLSVAGE
ncbi:TldD/PmbA family protein [Eubacteriales bacterium OttesenSCG-928-N13]|nr:TldD/PmbA family protein [Eubacteriales bacterium OttesenSCG-928-N13]